MILRLLVIALLFTAAAVFTLAHSQVAMGATITPEPTPEYLGVFRSVITVRPTGLVVPTLVEMPVASDLSRTSVCAVEDTVVSRLVPCLLQPGSWVHGAPRQQGDFFAVRFVATPDVTYRIYLDPVTTVSTYPRYGQNLSGSARSLPEGVAYPNQLNLQRDTDSDGIANVRDNCPEVANTDQVDRDQNGTGDLCEDHDLDGVLTYVDNCPTSANADQYDIDHDGVGDVCDTSDDRMFERNPWISWSAVIFAAGVLVLLSYLGVRRRV